MRRPDSGWRLAFARTLAWSLLLAGWLVLGALGQQAMPLAANGLVPLALWLIAIGSAVHLSRDVLLSTRALRGGVLAAGLSCAGALVWGGPAIAVAAVSWGALLVAASRVVRSIRGVAPHAAPPVVPAAIGAIVAWSIGAYAPMLAAPGVAGAAVLLASLLPRAAASRGCRAGLFDCALPLAPLAWRDPSAWGLHAARWSMLPMMATLAVMAPWCGESFSAAGWIAIHLAAMLLPACVLHAFGVRSRAEWIVLAMALGLAAWLSVPGWRGLMLMSVCQSAAWGLAWMTQLGGRAKPAPPRPIDALLPALVVFALGIAVAQHGPRALEMVQGAIAMVAIVGWGLARWPVAARRLS